MKKEMPIKFTTAKFTLALLILSATLYGCGKETIGDTVSRNQDRDRESANIVAGDYDEVKGVYQGSTSTADIFAIITPSRVNSSTNTNTGSSSSIPQPILVGSLIVTPHVAVVNSGEKIRNTFPFNDGLYDKRSHLLTFTVERQGTSSLVSCKVDKSSGIVLTCNWSLRTTGQDLILGKKSNDTKASTMLKLMNSVNVKQPTGSYAGGNEKYNVTAEFEGGLIKVDGSQVPEVTIMGHITFSPKGLLNPADPSSGAKPAYPSAIKEGTYDPASNKITLTMDEDSKITVSCKIRKNWSLDCEWNARGAQRFVLEPQ